MKKFCLLPALMVATAIQVANAQAPQGIPSRAVARENAANRQKTSFIRHFSIRENHNMPFSLPTLVSYSISI